MAPVFLEGFNKHAQPIWHRRKLINLETIEKHRLSEVTLGSWSLPGFHEALLRLALSDGEFSVVDGSAWFSQFPNGPREYYLHIFLGLTAGTVLCEQFDSNKEEENFFARVVRPAFDEAARILGREPAIVPLCQGRHAASPLWYAYPDNYRAHFRALGIEP